MFSKLVYGIWVLLWDSAVMGRRAHHCAAERFGVGVFSVAGALIAICVVALVPHLGSAVISAALAVIAVVPLVMLVVMWASVCTATLEPALRRRWLAIDESTHI